MFFRDVLLGSFDAFHQSNKITREQFTVLVDYLTWNVSTVTIEQLLQMIGEKTISSFTKIIHPTLFIILTLSEWSVLHQIVPQAHPFSFTTQRASEPMIFSYAILPPETPIAPLNVQLSADDIYRLSQLQEFYTNEVQLSPKKRPEEVTRRHRIVRGDRNRIVSAQIEDITMDLVPLVGDDSPNDSFQLRLLKTDCRPFIREDARDFAYAHALNGLETAQWTFEDFSRKVCLHELLVNYELLVRRYQVALVASSVKNGLNHAGDLAPNWAALVQEEPEFIRVINELAVSGDQGLVENPPSELLRIIRQFCCRPVLQRFFQIAEVLNVLKNVSQKPVEVFCGLLVKHDVDVASRRGHVMYKTIVAIWDWQLKDEPGFTAMPVDVRERWEDLKGSIGTVDNQLCQRILAILA
jgi:hypothetical protein